MEVEEQPKIAPVEVEFCENTGFPVEYLEYFSQLKKFKSLFEENNSPEEGKEEGEQKEKKKKKEESSKIILYKQKVNKKRGKTLIFNLDKFKINLKDTAKLCSKKFACSSTVVTEKGKDCVNLMGYYDFDLIEFLIGKFPELDESSFKVMEGK